MIAMAMKPITSFFNSPPPKKVQTRPTECALLQTYKNENCNGKTAVVNGGGEEYNVRVNGIQQRGTKEKNKLSRKKSVSKEKLNVENGFFIIEIADEQESKNSAQMSSKKVACVSLDMSNNEMSYEDFLTSQDPDDAEEISVIKDSNDDDYLSGAIEKTSENISKPIDCDDSQDIFSEDVVAGCPLLKEGAPLDANISVTDSPVSVTIDTSERTVKEKRNSKLSRKSKTVTKDSECQENGSEQSEEFNELSTKKTAKKPKSSGAKQMTLFGKVIDNVPKLEAEMDAEIKPENELEENLAVEPAPKSKSIMNFFSKVDKKFGTAKKPSSEKVTCKAVIHERTVVNKVTSSPDTTPDSRQKVSPRRKSNVAGQQIDMSITELGSQIITITEKKKRSRRQVIEENGSNVAMSTTEVAIVTQNQSCAVTSKSNDDLSKDIDPIVISEEDNEMVVDSKPKSVDDNHDDDDLVIVGATEDTNQALRKTQLANQMAYLDTVPVAVSKRATQATLNFSGKGSLIQKAAVQKTEAKEVKTKKSTKSDESDVEIVECAPKKQERGKKIGKKKVKQRQSIGDKVTPPKNTRNRRHSIDSPVKTPSKRVYTSRILPSRRNSLPGLRMKFTSIRSTTSTEELDNTAIEELAQITAKMSKAQHILDRAKKASHSKAKAKQKGNLKARHTMDKELEKLVKEELVSPTLRRSSRQSSVVAKTAISECLSPAEFVSPKGKQKKKTADNLDTPTKTPKSKKSLLKNDGSKTSSRTPKKKVKLASIFKAKGNKQQEDGSEEDEVEVTKVQIDPEVLKVRREFLLSGVPSALKKQTETSYAVTLDDYPPIPEISHVRQCPANDDPRWTSFNLKDVALEQLKPVLSSSELNFSSSERLTTGLLSNSAQIMKPCVKLYGVELATFEEETVKYLLAEVSTRNQSFPVRRIYKQLVKKYEQTKGTWVETSHPTEKENPKEKKNSKKRKLLLGEAEKPARRSKRRRAGSDVYLKSDEDECSIVEEPKPENVDKSRDLLWTDKYSPSSSTEVLTTSMNSKRLKSWLEEWRQRTDLEMKKIKKQLMKEAKKDSKIKEEIQKSLGDSWWTDDESDFEIDTEDDSDYEGEDICDGLCNTMVLTGPHGVGKTAMVYAVAQELGYKIFEVNASSKRAGKQMIAELQEATQSHQVAQHNMDKLFTTFKMIQTERRKSMEDTKPEKKMNSMFASFFKNSSTSAPAPPKQNKKESKTPKKTPEKPAKGKKGETPALSKGNKELTRRSPKKGLNLNSTSLILFEEVDVIFEEDKGFWTAIETFMNTTKRPIILTASDPKVAAAVNRRHETIKIKRSPVINVASYLQLVCLAEKLRVDHDDVVSLVKSCNGDLRRAILTLQYWVLSGAGSSKMLKPLKYDPRIFNKKQQITPMLVAPALLKQNSALDSGKESEEEFEITTKKRRRQARPVLDSGDESSNASPVKPLKFTDQPFASDSAAEDSQDGFSNVARVTDKELVVAPVIAPATHGLVWHSSCGPPVHDLSSSGDLLQMLQEPGTSCQAWELVSWYLSSKFNLIYANLMQLLDLPKVQLVPPRLPIKVADKPDAKKRRRIKMNSDIFDCEDSDTENEKLPDDTENTAMEVQDVSEEKSDEQEKVATPEDALAASGVKILSELYDNLSFSDAYFSGCELTQEGPCSHNEPFHWSSGQLFAGLTDSHPTQVDHNVDSLACDFHAGLNIYSIHKTNQKLQCLKHKANSLEPNSKKSVSKLLCLPVPSDIVNSSELQLSSECSAHVRIQTCRKQANEHVSYCLPPSVHCNHRALTCDFMPYIRSICQCEQLRQASNTKRRFTHYLDTVSLGVTRKQTVLDVLCTSFT